MRSEHRHKYSCTYMVKTLFSNNDKSIPCELSHWTLLFFTTIPIQATLVLFSHESKTSDHLNESILSLPTLFSENLSTTGYIHLNRLVIGWVSTHSKSALPKWFNRWTQCTLSRADRLIRFSQFKNSAHSCYEIAFCISDVSQRWHFWEKWS